MEAQTDYSLASPYKASVLCTRFLLARLRLSNFSHFVFQDAIIRPFRGYSHRYVGRPGNRINCPFSMDLP